MGVMSERDFEVGDTIVCFGVSWVLQGYDGETYLFEAKSITSLPERVHMLGGGASYDVLAQRHKATDSHTWDDTNCTRSWATLRRVTTQDCKCVGTSCTDGMLAREWSIDCKTCDGTGSVPA